MGCLILVSFWRPLLPLPQVTFYIFHWQKGSPIPQDQGKYDKLTYWEQARARAEGRGAPPCLKSKAAPL